MQTNLRRLIRGVIIPEKIPCLGSVTVVIVTFSGVEFRFGIWQHKQRRERRLLHQHLVNNNDVVYGGFVELELFGAEVVVPLPRDFQHLLVHLIATAGGGGGDHGILGPEIEAQRGDDLRDGGAAGEAVEAVTLVVGGSGSTVGFHIAVVAEDEVVGGAAEDSGVGLAGVANLEAHVLEGEGVGGVHVLVAN